jgi:hypothetical protein
MSHYKAVHVHDYVHVHDDVNVNVFRERGRLVTRVRGPKYSLFDIQSSCARDPNPNPTPIFALVPMKSQGSLTSSRAGLNIL